MADPQLAEDAPVHLGASVEVVVALVTDGQDQSVIVGDLEDGHVAIALRRFLR